MIWHFQGLLWTSDAGETSILEYRALKYAQLAEHLRKGLSLNSYELLGETPVVFLMTRVAFVSTCDPGKLHSFIRDLCRLRAPHATHDASLLVHITLRVLQLPLLEEKFTENGSSVGEQIL